MRSFTFVLCVTTAAISSVANAMVTPGLAIRAEVPSVTGKMMWQGESLGMNVTMYGTASEIKEQLKAFDPAWVPAKRTAKREGITNQLGSANCCPHTGEPWNMVSIFDIQTSINHFWDLGGTCSQAAKSCGVAAGNSTDITSSSSALSPAACVNGAGIHICNDNNYTISWQCDEVAQFTTFLIEQCSSDIVDGAICGQIFYDNGSNVVISQC